MLYFKIYTFQTFKSSKHVYFLSGCLIKQKKNQIFIFTFHSWETPPPHFSIFLNTDQIAELYIDARDA